MRIASEAVKGSDWEDILYPEAVDLETRRMLKDFRAKHDEIYPEDIE